MFDSILDIAAHVAAVVIGIALVGYLYKIVNCKNTYAKTKTRSKNEVDYWTYYHFLGGREQEERIREDRRQERSNRQRQHDDFINGR